MFAELLGFPSGELGPAVISSHRFQTGDYYENTYRGSDPLLFDVRRSNRYLRNQCPMESQWFVDWNSADNWTPNVVPNGPADIATFGLSNQTFVQLSADTEVNSIIFTPAATNPYAIAVGSIFGFAMPHTLTLNGAGIIKQFWDYTDVLC